MKKTTLMMLLLATLKTYAHEDNFQGFALNVGVGGTIANYDVDQTIRVVIPQALHIVAQGTELTDNNIAGLVSLSYTKAWSQRWFMGLELSAGLERTHVNKWLQLQEMMSSFGLFGATEVNMKNNIGLVAEPGFALDPYTLVYGLAGARWGRFDISSNVHYGQNFGPGISPSGAIPLTTISSTKTGWTLGAGVRRALSEHFSLGAEYQFTHYGNVAAPGILMSPVMLNNVAVGTLQINVPYVNTNTNTLLMKLSYLV